MKLTLAKGIIPASTEAEDSVGIVVDWIPPPPLPCGLPISNAFPPPGLTTITVSLLSVPSSMTNGTTRTSHMSPSRVNDMGVCGGNHNEPHPKDRGEEDVETPHPSLPAASVGTINAVHEGTFTTVLSDSISVVFSEDADHRVVLPYFFSPAVWKGLCMKVETPGTVAGPMSTTTTTATSSTSSRRDSASVDVASPAILQLLVEISFGSIAAATALLRPVTETVTSMWSAFSSQVFGWGKASTTTTTTRTAALLPPSSTNSTSTTSAPLPSSNTTETNHPVADLFGRFEVAPSSVLSNAEVLQERVTSVISSAAATLTFFGGRDEGDEGVSNSSSVSPTVGSIKEVFHSVRRPWYPPPPPHWADRKEYWEHLILERLGKDTATYLTRPSDLSTLSHSILLESLENFGFSIPSLVALYPKENTSTMPANTEHSPPLFLLEDESTGTSVNPENDEAETRKRKKIKEIYSLTAEECWRQFMWKCSALALCTIEDEVEVVLRVLNYDSSPVFLRPPGPSSAVSLTPDPKDSVEDEGEKREKEEQTEAGKLLVESEIPLPPFSFGKDALKTSMPLEKDSSASTMGTSHCISTSIPNSPLNPPVKACTSYASSSSSTSKHCATTLAVEKEENAIPEEYRHRKAISEREVMNRAGIKAEVPANSQTSPSRVVQEERKEQDHGHEERMTQGGEGGDKIPHSCSSTRISSSEMTTDPKEKEISDECHFHQSISHHDPSASLPKTSVTLNTPPDKSATTDLYFSKSPSSLVPKGVISNQKEKDDSSPSEVVGEPAVNSSSNEKEMPIASRVPQERDTDSEGKLSKPLHPANAFSSSDAGRSNIQKEHPSINIYEKMKEQLEFPRMPWEEEEDN